VEKNPYKAQYYLALMEIYREQKDFENFGKTAALGLKTLMIL
jgi:hypothetical protein